MGRGRYFIFIFACAMMNVIDAHAESRMLEITSQTEKPSADCIIKKLNEKKDKARKEIGIGEIVTLTLTRKGGKLLNKNTKVTWTKKGNGATLKGRGTTATLTADLIMENNNVTVKAEADDFPPAEITFNIKKPTHLTGKREKNPASNQILALASLEALLLLYIQLPSVLPGAASSKKMAVPSLIRKLVHHLTLTIMIRAITAILPMRVTKSLIK